MLIFTYLKILKKLRIFNVCLNLILFCIGLDRQMEQTALKGGGL